MKILQSVKWRERDQFQANLFGKWLQNSPQIIANSASDCPRLPGGCRKPFFPEVENELLRFFKEKRENKLSVKKDYLRRHAIKFIEEQEDVKI